MNTRDQFLVVGAGPLGLAMAKALGESGLPYTQIEATDHVGGNWAHGVYKTAHIISSRRTTEYPDFPMPSDYPDFPSAAQMCDYYNEPRYASPPSWLNAGQNRACGGVSSATVRLSTTRACTSATATTGSAIGLLG